MIKYFLLALCIIMFCTKSICASKNIKVQKSEDENTSIMMSIDHANQKWYKMMQKPHPNYFAVKKEYDKFIKKHYQLSSAPKEYGMSWLKTKLYYLDSKGNVQDSPKPDYNSMPIFTDQDQISSDSISGDWKMIGPVNTFNGNGAGSGNNGGYVYCVRFDPTNPNKLFCSFVTGGLWESSDNGANWKLTDANLPATAYYDIDVCTADNKIVYAVCQNAIIKSTNGGFSWNPTKLNSSNYSGNGIDIAVSPTNSNLIIARWDKFIYRSSDGGSNWVIIKSGLKTFGIWDSNLNSEVLDWDNNDENIIYFTDRGDNQSSVDLYISTDQGISFKLLKSINIPTQSTGNITGWSKISTSTNSKNSVGVLIGTGANSYSHRSVHLFKLDKSTGEIILQRLNMIDGVDGNYGSITSLHHGDIAIDIDNDSNIVWGSYSQQNVQYSTNMGETFYTSTTNVHSDLRSIYFKNGKVLLGTDGSGLVSSDGGDNFNIVTSNISNHELWGFGASFKSGILAAGANHGPLIIRDKDDKDGWYTLLGADQGNSDFNPLDSVSSYSQGYDSYHITLQGNKKWINSSQQIDPGGIYSYFNTMEFHPNLFHTLITHHAGGYPSSVPQATRDIWKKSLIRSDDNGLTVNVVYTFADQLFREKICISDTNYIYCVVGLSNNKVFKTSNAGKSFVDITPSSTITTSEIRNISDISVSDVNPKEIWIAYSGVQNKCKVLHSIDGGLTWENLSQSILTDYPITKLIFQRGTDGGVYVGNQSGVFYKNNTMQNWTKVGSGLPQLDIRFMFANVYQNKLQIGTSRGAWEHTLFEHSIPLAQISANTNSATCQNPYVQFRDYSTVSNTGFGAKYLWKFNGGNPSISTSETPLVSYLGAKAGTYDVSLTVSDDYGTNTQILKNFINYSTENCCDNLPNTWSKVDIGTSNKPSELCYTPKDGNFKITNHSSGIGGTSDNIMFIYQAMIGDIDIVAKVKDVSKVWNYSAGLMIRKSLNPNSEFVYTSSLDERGVFDIYRTTDGGNSSYQLVTTLPMPMWLKLERKANKITSFYSSDGINWTLYHNFNMSLNDTIYAGISASNDGCIANIDNVKVNGLILSTPEDFKINKLNFYPFPIQNQFNISGLEGCNKIEFYSSFGQLLNSYYCDFTNFEVNLGNYPNGVYFVRIINENPGKSYTQKIIKIGE